jgi:hypothetical protein
LQGFELALYDRCTTPKQETYVMVTKSRKPAITLTRGLFDAARKALDEAPELPADQQPITMREGISSMRQSIEAAKARGYSVERIAELLRDAGLDITPATLATYARPSQRTRTATKTRTPKKAGESKADGDGPRTGTAPMSDYKHNPVPNTKELL